MGVLIFFFDFGVAPFIASVSPSSFSSTATGVTINGSGFGAVQAPFGEVFIGNNATIGLGTGFSQTVVSWSETQIVFSVTNMGTLSEGVNWVYVIAQDPATFSNTYQVTIGTVVGLVGQWINVIELQGNRERVEA